MKKLFFMLMVVTMALPVFSFATAPSSENTDDGLAVCDINNDGARNLSDVSLYAGCAETFDVNNDGVHDLTDVSLYASNYRSSSWCKANFKCAPNSVSNTTDDPSLNVCDLNNDGVRNLSDVSLFAGCAATFDVNGDGAHDLTDTSLYSSNNQNNAWCRTNFRCAPTITDFSSYLNIWDSRITKLSPTSLRIYWAANIGSIGQYRYTKNQSELSGLPWRTDGVINDPAITGNMFGSQVDLSGLDIGTTYYIEVRKNLGTQYGAVKYMIFRTDNVGMNLLTNLVDKKFILGQTYLLEWQYLEEGLYPVNRSLDYATDLILYKGELELGKIARVTGTASGMNRYSWDLTYSSDNFATKKIAKPGSDYQILFLNEANGINNRTGNFSIISSTNDDVVLPDPATKVKVCHVLGNGRFNTLEVAADAVAAHTAHGDKLGECNESEDDDVRPALPVSAKLIERVRGRILLQVENHGEAWYVNPKDDKRFYLKDGVTAYSLMREAGLGITNVDLAKIPVGFEDRFNDTDTDGDGLADKLESGLGTDPNKADSDGDGVSDKAEILARTNPLGTGVLSLDNALANRLKGRIVLQVQSRGEAWYIDPSDGKRYYMRDGEAAYQIMRFRSLGITNSDLAKIAE